MKAGHITTFYRLINSEAMIIIPKVQRDYAYGRLTGNAPAILDGMLSSMHKALRKNRREIFDFVYGGAYESNDNSYGGMIPLDGQQRLTTLFLLHFYASVIESVDNEEVKKLLGKFRYETRQSANDFCCHLIGPIRENILKTYRPGVRISDLIKDDPLYSPAYANDPTISAMLIALDAIESKFRTFRHTQFRRASIGLWTALATRDNLCFYHITLDRFGLNDDMYIKMNSRGKRLTAFEIFKADLEERVREIDPDKADVLARKIDTEWIDMPWSLHRNDPKATDSSYMQLLNNILRIICHYKHRLDYNPAENELLTSAITDGSDADDLIDLLTVMHQIYVKGFQAEWGKYFYYTKDEIIGRADKIRQFSLTQSIFVTAMDNKLTNPEMVQFLASYLVEKNTASTRYAMRALRVIRNLIRANQQANDFRIKDIPGFMADTHSIVESICNNAPLPASMTFTSTAAEEERRKQSFADTDYDALLKYENHSVLNGSIGLFINRYVAADSIGCTDLRQQLDHFEQVFDNNCMNRENFEKIRINLLDTDMDYSQWEAGDEQDKDTRRRYLHRPSDYSDFLTANIRRRNQNVILDIISKLPVASSLKSNLKKCTEFPKSDFRYYMAKYYASNSTETKYGYYGWHDINRHPLDAYLLNSSYFGPTNLAWSMMLHILHDRFYNHPLHQGSMSWNQHQAPLHFTKIDLVVDFADNNWILTTSIQATAHKLRTLSRIMPLTIHTDDNHTVCKIYNSNLSRHDYMESVISVIESLTNRFALIPRGWNTNRFTFIKRK